MEKTEVKTYDHSKQKKHNRTQTIRAFGRSYCYITCPFCNETVKAFIWSLSGGGKKCTCGAIHSSFGLTSPSIKWYESNKHLEKWRRRNL